MLEKRRERGRHIRSLFVFERRTVASLFVASILGVLLMLTTNCEAQATELEDFIDDTSIQNGGLVKEQTQLNDTSVGDVSLIKEQADLNVAELLQEEGFTLDADYTDYESGGEATTPAETGSPSVPSPPPETTEIPEPSVVPPTENPEPSPFTQPPTDAPEPTPVPTDAPEPTPVPTTAPEPTPEPTTAPEPDPTETPSSVPTDAPIPTISPPTPLPTPTLPPTPTPEATATPPPVIPSVPPSPPPTPKPEPYAPLMEALLSFKEGIPNGGEVEELKSWKEGTDPCGGWEGVSCDDQGNIISLNLRRTNPRMDGEIPSSLASKSLEQTIETIDLSDNKFTGSIISQFSESNKFQNLVSLNLEKNSLSGGLLNMPEGVQKLETFQLNDNQMVAFPFAGTFKSLRTLTLYNNQISDPIPSTFSNVLGGADGKVILQPQANDNSVCGTLPADSNQWYEIDIVNPICDTNLIQADENGCFTQLTSLPACSDEPFPSPPPPLPSTISPDVTPSTKSDDSIATWIIIVIVAVGCGILLILVVLLVFLWRKKQRRLAEGKRVKSIGSKMEQGYIDSSKASIQGIGNGVVVPVSPNHDSSNDLLMDWSNSDLKLDENGLNHGFVAAVVTSDTSNGKHTQHSSSGNIALDVKLWTLDFKDLKIEKQIGEGSFGRVYQAKWNETPVAVKILIGMGTMEEEDEQSMTLSSPVLNALAKESTMMAALRHPNVVSFLGVCLQPPSIVTEYCARKSLTDVLRGAKSSPAKASEMVWTRRLNMVLDAAKGMLYLHAHTPPIIHRDLKSPNLLVDGHWRVKVSDFNLSKLLEEGAAMSSMAATNPRWLAPEILAGNPATFASDVYAFAIVLWELLTWELPWGPTNPWQVRKGKS